MRRLMSGTRPISIQSIPFKIKYIDGIANVGMPVILVDNVREYV